MDRPEGTPGRIFISYRREDTAYPAGWLFDRLTEHYGEGQVFKDVDSIDLGEDFVDAIDEAVGGCEVLLALIGDHWLDTADAAGGRRLDDPDDFVRREVEAALRRGVRVVPVLVDGALMPLEADVPPSLAPLTRRQAIEVHPARFNNDVQRLVADLDGALVRRPSKVHRRLPWGLVVGAAAAAVLVVVVAAQLLPDRGPGTSAASSSSAPGSSPVSSPSAAATTGSPPSAVGSPSPAVLAGRVMFRDDFSAGTLRWTSAPADSTQLRRVGGRLRFSLVPLPGGAAAGAFPEAGAIRPPALDTVSVQVTGRRVSAQENLEWGFACQTDDSGHGYLLTMSGTYVELAKSSEQAEYEQLARVPHGMDITKPHTLVGTCTTQDGAARLVLTVDGRTTVTATDADGPLPAGGVNLYMGATGRGPAPAVVDVDDVAVATG
ncbi:MAG: toll/interleukin-1 receptor domain-containing protein [Kineosporiaceae bacterium]